MATETPLMVEKTPGEELDYQVNWAGGDNWLGADTISTSSWAIEAENNEAVVAVTESNSTNNTTTATIWVTGGTIGVRYRLINTIVTAGGRTAKRTIYLDIVKNRPQPSA